MLSAGCAAEEFGLLWDHLNVVLFSIVHSKLQKSLEAMNVITEKGNIISLSNISTVDIPNVESKTRLLCDKKFLVVCQFINSVRVYATLLYSKLVLDWSHEGLGPINISVSVLQSVVKIEEALAISASKVSRPYAEFSQDFIKCTFGIKEDTKSKYDMGPK